MFVKVNPSTSLAGSTVSRMARSSRCFGSGNCDQDPVDLGVAVQTPNEPRSSVLGDVARRDELPGGDAGLLAGFRLAADIGGRGRVIADEDGRQARDPARRLRSCRTRSRISSRSSAAIRFPSMIRADGVILDDSPALCSSRNDRRPRNTIR